MALSQRRPTNAVTHSLAHRPPLPQVRIIKLLRLLKLSRILEASAIMKRLESTMELTYATIAMTRLLVGMVAWCHFQVTSW